MSAMRTGLVGATLVFVAPACLRDDPNHCANRNGNASCVQGDAGQYCSICVAEHNGCVPQMPDAACYRPVEQDSETDITAGSSSSGTSGTSGVTTLGETTTTTPTECDSSMPMDPACPASQPYCNEDSCASCEEAGGDSFCSGLNPERPICSTERATCVECTPNNLTACELPTINCGTSLQCAGCVLHDDCNSACDLGANMCLDAPILYVDNKARNCPTEGDGTLGSPHCTIAAAVSAAGQNGIIMLAKGDVPYVGSVTVGTGGGKTIAIIGQDQPVMEVDGTAVEVMLSSRLFLHGVTIRQSTLGLQCTDSEVWLTSSAVQTSAQGINAQGCNLHLIRSRVVGQSGDGIVTAGGSLEVVSTIIAGNASSGSAGGLRADGTELAMDFITFANNGPFNIDCDGTVSGRIRSSVLVSPAGSSITDCGALEVHRSVLDTMGQPGDDQVEAPPWDPTWFSNVDILDYHVRTGADSPFRDVGQWVLGSPFQDVDGDPIDFGLDTPVFAGADQP